jgi:2-succinyl-6-hydroxy-2,4-cyclohexadiene-1-carboxylate synthase
VRFILVPGFTQTPASWRRVQDALDASAEVVTVHVEATFAATAAAIGDRAGEGMYVGYSMGGRLCLQLALDRPDIVRALVLVSASPGLADPAERADRVAADEALARRVERVGTAAFLDEWLAQPMFATVPDDAPGLAERRDQPASYLAACLRRLGTGAMAPLWDRLRELDMPVLLVTGTRDAKFGDIAGAMLDRMGPNATHVRVDSGHAVPLEAPGALAEEITAFHR